MLSHANRQTWVLEVHNFYPDIWNAGSLVQAQNKIMSSVAAFFAQNLFPYSQFCATPKASNKLHLLFSNFNVGVLHTSRWTWQFVSRRCNLFFRRKYSKIGQFRQKLDEFLLGFYAA